MQPFNKINKSHLIILSSIILLLFSVSRAYSAKRELQLQKTSQETIFDSPDKLRNSALGPGSSAYDEGLKAAQRTFTLSETQTPQFYGGYNPDEQSPWEQWNAAPISSIDPLRGYKEIPYDSALAASNLDEFKIVGTDDGVRLNEKMNGIVQAVAGDVELVMERADIVSGEMLEGMFGMVDAMYAVSDQVYADLGSMYDEVDGLNKTLERNYQEIEQMDSISEEAAARFNKFSDMMADRAATMSHAIDGMVTAIQSNRQILDGLTTALNHRKLDADSLVKFCDQLISQMDDSASQYAALAAALERQDDYYPYDSSGAEAFFRSQKEYLKSFKEYISGTSVEQLNEVQKYLTETATYLEKITQDLARSREDFAKQEEYFRSAKVSASGASEIISAADMSGNICDGAKKPGLKPLQECSKSCRTVCRWKENVGGAGCYECPSGSPDSCYDVGAWPADHPWCEPGGVCHSDPMLYCTPFGTTGPNLEKLQCTNCKQRPDMCWQKLGGGMTLTNCKMGCWDGKCVYKGKYQENEWDGSPEFIHCYECKTPPPPPTCEELGWGYDWQATCENNCPDPGKCEEKTMPPGAGKKKGADGDDDGDEGDDGEGDGPDDEGEDGGGTGERGGDDDVDQGGGGSKPTPPTGTPEQPTGGGAGTSSGGEKQADGGQPAPGEEQADKPQKPDQPTTERPTQPQQPDGKKPDIEDPNPPAPPDNQEIQWLKSRIRQVDERIESRTEIINDEREGDGTRAEAWDQRESFKKEKERLEEKLREEEQRELERQQKEEKERVATAERQREASRTRWPDPKEEMQKIRLQELKDATEALKKKAEEARDALTGRQERIDRLDREINLLEREIKHHEDAAKSGSEDETQARDTIKRLQEELARKKTLRNDLAKLLKEAQAQYQEEINKLKTDYRKKLNAADEGTRRRVEAERIDEYYDRQIDLEHAKASRALRNQVFDEEIKEMEAQIAQERANGNDDKADELQTQVDNLKRGQAEFDKSMETRIKSIENELYEMGYHRNFDEGAGPTSKENLIDKINEYTNIVDGEIKATENKIKELEQGETRTPDQNAELDKLRQRLGQLQDSRSALQEKQDILKNGYKLPDDIAENIRNSTGRFSEGAKNQAADKSMARLFAESLGEEYVHNLRPDVAIKKSVAFAWGMAKGVGSAVKGLGEMTVGMADLSLETYAHAFGYVYGFDGSTLFGSDSSEKLYGVLSTVYDNANFDGLIKAVVAAGGAIDGKLKQLERSGDIDWATSEFGGEVAGEFVVGDMVIAGVVGKAGKALGVIDDVTDAGRVAGKVDDAVDAGRGGTRAAEHVDDLADAGKVADDVPTSGSRSRGTHVDDAPTRKPDVDKPPTRAPPADDVPTRIPDDSPTGARAPRSPDAPTVRTPDVDRPPARAPPDDPKPTPKPSDPTPLPRQEVRPPKPYDNNVPLRDVNKQSPQRLADDIAENLEKEHGFRRDHAQRMNEFAQEKGTYLLVRDGNVDSVRHFDNPEMMPKPMSSKAKTAQVGDNVGLVVNPFHERQAKFWDDAINRAKQAGDKEELANLQYLQKKAHNSWNDNWAKMQKDGYRVNPETGVVEFVEKFPDGSEKVWKGIHGDYDLHGVYKKNPDGSMEHVSFGEGQKFDDNGVDVSGGKLRQQLNDKISGGNKSFVQHGGQDDWIPDPAIIPQKGPDPPVTVFFPDGRPPVHLADADALKAFYEGEMGVKWPYPDPKPPAPSAAKAADAATDVAAAKSTGTSAGAGSASVPSAKPPALSVGHQADAPLTFFDTNGDVVSLQTGKRLGSGSTSTAYVHGSDPTKVVRITEFNPKAKSAPILDEVGRNAIEEIAKKAGADSPVRVVPRYEKYQIDSPGATPLNGAHVEVTQFLPQGTAENMIASQGGKMTKGQAKAFDAATREFNKNGYAWLDNHSGNYTFEPMPGGGPDDWRVVVMDPGGIVPMEGASLAEKAKNARAIQERVNLPRPEFKSDMDMVKNMNEVLKRGVAAEEKERILGEFGSKIDMEALGKLGITDVNDVAFYPGGTLDFDEIQKLTTMSPVDAKAY